LTVCSSAKLLVLAALLVQGLGASVRAAAAVDEVDRPQDILSYVDPFIGTKSRMDGDAVIGGRGGNVNPGAVVPFGMVQWSPETYTLESSSFEYTQQQFTGFSLTHLSGAGCVNSGELPMIATVGAQDTRSDLAFERDPKTGHPGKARPGSYEVKLKNGVSVELTATPRTGFARVTFPPTRTANLVFDAARTSTTLVRAQISKVRGRKIIGQIWGGRFCGAKNNHKLNFVIETNRPFQQRLLDEDRIMLTFNASEFPTVLVKVALSYVSEANADLNLRKESPDWNFQARRTEAEAEWREKLGRITLDGGKEGDRKVFYTALYHSLLHPNVFSDVNGEYIGADGKLHTEKTRTQYANFSGWDVYRTQVSLLAWLYTREASDIAQSLLNFANQCGGPPKWMHNSDETGIMVGDPGSLIFANMYAFGARNFGYEQAFRKMERSGAEAGVKCQSSEVRPGYDEYLKLGYVTPHSQVWGPVATTLEYSTANAAIAEMARQLGHRKEYVRFRALGRQWQNLLDVDRGGFFQREHDGSWAEHTALHVYDSRSAFVEGTAGQYLWAVPQDPRALIRRLGGSKRAESLLDQHFQKLNAGPESNYFYIGNQVGFHVPWMYLWTGSPAKSQSVIRRILTEEFRPTPDGLPGNDDLGSLSSWYVWNALGLYPVKPGVGGLAVGKPLFKSIKILLGNGRGLQIETDGNLDRSVQSAEWNRRPLVTPWLNEAQVQNGGALRLQLGRTSSTWGSRILEFPP